MEEEGRAARTAPVGLGQGYDRVLGEGRNTALTPTTETFGGESTVRYRVCEGMEELMDELEVTQSLTVGLAGIVSVSQKLEFIKSQKLTTHSVCIVVYAKHTEGTETVTNVALQDNVQAPENEEELNEFFQVYGDCYMSSRTIGGEYFGVYTFYTETLEEREQLTAEMKVGGIFKAFVGEVGLQSKIDDFRSSQNTRVSFDQRSTGIANPAFPTADNVIQYALDFPSLELTAPVLTLFQGASYMRVPGIGSRFNVIEKNVLSLIGGKVAAQLSHLEQLHNDIDSIVDVYNTFDPGHHDLKLLQVKEQADADLQTLRATIRSFERDPTRLLVIPVLPSLGHGTPSLAFATLEERDQFELSNGQVFNDMGKFGMRGWLQQRIRITALQMRMSQEYSGKFPYQLGLLVTYTSGYGDGSSSWTETHGPSKGLISSRLAVPQGQGVIHITGTRGPSIPAFAYITHLSVELSNQQRLAYGQEIASGAFELRAHPGFFVAGLRGRRDDWTLYDLQAVCASFLPAVWRT